VKRLLLACIACLPVGTALAQTYPAKPLKWIIPFAAGGPMDVLSRAIAPPLSASLGQPVVLEIRPSTSGIVGIDAAAKSPPDGYTLLTHGLSVIPQKFLYKSLPYDLQKDLAPITQLSRSSMVLFVHESVPARTLAELVAHSKANPGKLAYGSSGVGQGFHLAMEMLKMRTGLDMLHVPYKGSAQTMPELIAGRVQAMFFTAVEQLVAQTRTGKLRAIAIAGDERLATLPGVPTLDEVGIRNFDTAGGIVVSAPGGTPKPIVDRLNRDIVRIAATPEMGALFARLNMQRHTTTPEQLAGIIRDNLDHWGPVIRKLGITLD
jgi:tripartite-type tricarboxylate transporter receptor subunit TctC